LCPAGGGRNAEAKDVGPVVVPCRVEALALFVEPSGLKLGVQDALLAVERAGEVGAIRRENRAPSAADDVDAVEQLREREVGGVRGGALEVTRADDEGARLAGDVDQRRLPAVAVVGGRGNVDLDAGLIEREDS
jgi:hypothetical protein